jgi:polyketide biosynthesis enoyl-CoA hydratase PksI
LHVQQSDLGIVELQIEDRARRNAFSLQLADELIAAFAAVESDESVKVVVLTGYDNYFANGGTKDGLLSIAQGAAKCTDLNIHGLPLECRVPVIAAIQGHAVGGGLVFGLLADVVILSRESLYAANFMNYGFTPGVGATCVMPQKLGMALAHEMLLSGRGYRGTELASRGVPFAVLPRAQVLLQAQAMARELADKPRASLVMLKDHLVRDLRASFYATVTKELSMHEVTFRKPEVRNRINDMFVNG